MRQRGNPRVTALLAVLVGCVATGLLLLIASVARAQAREPAKVLLVHSEPRTPLLEEVLIRTQGELRAVGLSNPALS